MLSNLRDGLEREVWISSPLDEVTPARLCIFLDAELYLREVDCLPALGRLESSLGPVTFTFVSSVSPAARHRDYLWNEDYADFIARDVVEFVGSKRRIVSGGHVICGLSLSGLESACVAFHHPSIFSGALCQSGSFWWFHMNKPELPRTTAKFWLSVGREETAANISHPPTGLFQPESQIAGVERAVALFSEAGGDVNYCQHAGGHHPEAWREELTTALRWLN